MEYDYEPMDFEDVRVYWAKVFEGMEDTYKGRSKWTIDICLSEEEYDALDEENFRVKEPRRKILKLKDSDDEKEQKMAEQEEDRGFYIQAIANAEIPIKDENDLPTGEVNIFDAVPVWDKDMNPWPENTPIGNNSICCLECEAKQWDGQPKVTLYLRGIQVIEHVPFEGTKRRKAGSTFKKRS